MTSTWFITGSSRGFGRAITEAVLASDHRVVATARDVSQLDDLVELHGPRVLPLRLDVTDRAEANSAVEAAVERFGRIDVVVNNAGYAHVAPVEAAHSRDFREQFETNFWGVYNVSVAVLPIMKRQGEGTIVQFSSIGGRVGGTPGLGSYQAAKFAVDGLTRVLAAETGPLGVRSLVVEPSGFATDWAGSSMRIEPVPAEYRDTVGEFVRRLGSAQMTVGEPRRAAEILVRVVTESTLPTHLLLGAGAVERALEYSRQQVAEATCWRALSESADRGFPYPVAV